MTHPLEVLSVSEARTGFTYRGLRAYWDRRRLWNSLEWHTVERNIRRFCEPAYGYLKRKRVGKVTVYYPTIKFWDIYETAKAMVRK